MSSPTTSGAALGAEMSQIPPIRTFEFDRQSIGKIKSSVNQFRGSVSLPIDLLTLPGRKGLDVKVAAMYSSNINRVVQTWNVDAPTGILGLGWQMPFEYIAVDKDGSGSPSSDALYLVANGAANPMRQVGETAEGLVRYQLQEYEFWEVLYDPKAEHWRVVKEDGSTYMYGGLNRTNDAVQWGVKWGNWIGASSRLDGQERYPVAWNLASITSVDGFNVSYRYDNVEFGVGSEDGLRYTQASYLKEIVDSFGRTVAFDYGEKYGARNPSPQGIVEYQAEHSGRPEPNAYQDRYETRYLDQVRVKSEAGELLFGLTFTYDFLNMAPTGDERYQLMWKRCLRSVFRWSPNGVTQPSLRFGYNSRSEVNPGALKCITYPSGGEATFTYKRNDLHAPKVVSVKNPLPDSTPRVWHGNDYVLFTYTGRGGNGLRAIVYSWNGRWVEQELTVAEMHSVRVAPESLWVATKEEFLTIAFRDEVSGTDQLYLFRKDPTGFGSWSLDEVGVRRLPLSDPKASASTFIAGDSFVVAYNREYAGEAFAGYSWDWEEGAWTSPALLPSSSEARAATGVALAAYRNYYVITTYDQDRREGRFGTFHRDAAGGWRRSRTWTNHNLDVLQSEGRLLWSWMPQASYGVATYVTGTDERAIRYSLRIFQWDEHFDATNPSDPVQADLETPVTGENQTLYEIFRTVTDDAFVNNNIANLRYEGGAPESARSANWSRRDFALGSPRSVSFASGDDVSVASETGSAGTSTHLLEYDPNQPAASAWSSPGVVGDGAFPTLAGNYMTVGRSIFFRESDGTWRLLSVQLSALGDEAGIQNWGPHYIAYQDATDSSAHSYLVTLKNGSAQPPIELPGGAQKLSVPKDEARPGTQLAGPRFLVTYPSFETLSTSTRLTLYNLDDGELGEYTVDYPVAYVTIENPFDSDASFVQSYFYGNSDQSQVAYDSKTGVAQYPRVVVVPDVRSLSETPPQDQPQGRSEYYYSNGLSPQADLAYPDGWVYNYQRILNGMLLAQRDYDSDRRLVSEQLNFWQVNSVDALSGKRLWGGYTRLVRTTVVQDGIAQTSWSEYDPRTGLVRWREQSYHDSQGKAKRIRVESLYAWEVPEYAGDFQARNYLSAVAQQTKSVADVDGGNRHYIESKTTTWRVWPSEGSRLDQTAAPAKWQVYEWTAPGESAPTFDFSSEGSRRDWLLTAQVKERTHSGGLIKEQVDVGGTPSSFVYDREERRLVASFPNGSVSGDEVDYWGMEPYESDPRWTLGSGASIAPAQGDEIDAHTGSHSLILTPGTTGDAGVRAEFTPARKQAYVFSAWVKVPESFDDRLGEARFLITVGAGKPMSLAFPAERGKWVYCEQRIEVDDPGTRVAIAAENANEQHAVRIDDLRFSPWNSLWSGVVYDARHGRPTAKVEANEASTRTVYDPLGHPAITTNAADRLDEMTGYYFSRSSHQGAFSVSDPNRKTTLKSVSAGELSTFTRGDEWQERWLPMPAERWRISDGRLCLEGDGEGTLTLQGGSDGRASYVLGAHVQPMESVARPLGIRIGDELTIVWDPQEAAWRVVDEHGHEVQPRVSPVECTVPWEPFAAQLEAGEITADLRRHFAEHDLLLDVGSSVQPLPAGNGWEIVGPDAAYRYEIRKSDAILSVVRLGRDWRLHVSETVLFWVDGKLIFSLPLRSPVRGAAQLFFGDRVALSLLASGYNPSVKVAFEDAAGNPLQEQSLEAGRTSVFQTFTDSMGRQAVVTKPAWVSPSSTRRLLDFVPDFAQLDWESGVMSGLVVEAYPEDAGYPYTRTRYERSPLGRAVEQGLPGDDFRIGAHSTRIRYGSNDSFHGLPEGCYTQTSTTDPNGVVAHEISTLLGQSVFKVSEAKVESGEHDAISYTRFDDAGNPVELRTPNYYNPPSGSTAKDWVTLQRFDHAGRLLRTEPGGEGATNLIYDSSGNLRFLQDPQGAQDGLFNYWKYDALGRQIEAGYLKAIWDRSELQRRADRDPDWPHSPDTWRRRNTWDGTVSGDHCVGRVVRVDAQNGEDSHADTHQTYRYDVFGNTTSVALTVKGVDGCRLVDYDYDDGGSPIRITYPLDQGESRWRVHYQYDPLRRVRAIAESDDFTDPLITYAYRADGRPERETYWPTGANPLERRFTFNSPIWLTGIQDVLSDGHSHFEERLSYTQNGFEGTGYFDGTVASARFDDSEGGNPTEYRYSYSHLGNLEHAQCDVDPSRNFGVVESLTYDLNGNFTSCVQGEQDRRYDYVPGTQMVERVVDPADESALARFTYNANGAALTAEMAPEGFAPSRALRFSYDPGTKMVQAVQEAGGTELRFLYGGNTERIVKEVWQNGERHRHKLYVRGANSYPLFEQTFDTNGAVQQETLYLFGPGGLVGMRRAGEYHTLLKDHLGSVRQVVGQDGDVIARYDYLTFGSLVDRREPESGFMPYLYTGQEYDQEIGLYNYRARFYASEIGRFLDVDPKRQFFSPYLYAANDPVAYVDPTGTFSFKSLFSAIGGVLIGAVEILVGVAVDVVAGVLEVVTGGLSTPASVALAALSGTFYGAGISSIMYSVFHVDDFDWKEYGIQMGIGAATGALAFGIGALGSAAAEGATGVKAAVEAGREVSQAARAANILIDTGVSATGGFASGVLGAGLNDAAHNVTPGLDLVEGGVWSAVTIGLGRAIPGRSYKEGWKELGKRVLTSFVKREAIGVAVNTSRNVIHGDPLEKGLLNAVVAGALWGSLGGLQAQAATKNALDFSHLANIQIDIAI